MASRPSDTLIVRDSKGGFAFQAMAGGAYKLSDQVHLYVGYRYFQADKPNNDVALLPATLKTTSWKLAATLAPAVQVSKWSPVR